MRVLIVTTWFPSASAPGLGVFNLRDAELLARDHEVTVLHLIDPASEDADDREVESLSESLSVRRVPFDPERPETVSDAVRWIRVESTGNDLVHSMAFPAILPLSLARLRLPWVHTEHWSGLINLRVSGLTRIGSRVLPRAARARMGGPWLRPELKRPDAVVAVGSGLKQRIESYRRGPTVIIGNGIRFPEDESLPQPPEERGDSALRLVAVGNLIAWKGPLELIHAVAELRRNGTDASLEWAGIGELEGEARKWIRELGLERQVTLLGHVAPEGLPDVLRRAHMFVLPTAGETFGIAIAEALACGLPVVISGTGAHTDYLPGRASRVVDSRSAGELARAIEDLASDKSRWSGRRIQEHARDRFSEERRRRAYGEVYARAVARRPRGR